MNIVIVSTCEYTFFCYSFEYTVCSSHGTDMVKNTNEIPQIHVTLYWVSTYIYAVYSQSLLDDT